MISGYYRLIVTHGTPVLGYRIQICRLYGFDVYIDFSWFFLLILILWTLSTKYFPAMAPDQPHSAYTIMAIAGLIGLCFSILMHEVAHALVAQYFRMRIGAITLWIFGGVADMSEETSVPKHEFFMALAGPVMSLALSAVFYILFYAMNADDLPYFAVIVTATALYLGQVNMVLALFNMIPAFPLDGGRVLRASLWHWRQNRVWATRMASHTGSFLALMMCMMGLKEIVFHNNLLNGLWSIMIGMFVTMAAGNSVREAISYSMFSGHPVSRYMRQDVISINSTMRLDTLVEEYFYKYYVSNLPVVDDGILRGYITSESIKGCDKRQWPWKTVGDYMTPLNADHMIRPDADSADALERMRRTGENSLIVADQGRLVGLVWLRDLLKLTSLKVGLEAPPKPIRPTSFLR